MKIKNDIINIIEKQFKDKSNIEKSDILNLSLYKLMKESKYFEDRYDDIRLVKLKKINSSDELITFGLKSLNNIKNHTNHMLSNWEYNYDYLFKLEKNSIKNLDNEDFSLFFEKNYDTSNLNTSYLLNDKDEILLNKVLEIISKSNDFYEFFNNSIKEIEQDPEFLYKIKYLYKENNVFDLISLFIENNDNLEKYNIEKKTKISIYYGSGFRHIMEKYLSKDQLLLLFDDNEKVKIDKNDLLLAENGHPYYSKKVNYIIHKSRKNKIDIKKEVINKNVYSKIRLLSKIIFQQIKKNKNEDNVLEKYNKEIDVILNIIKKKYQILESKKTNKAIITHLDNSNKNLDINDFPKQNWSLDDWNLDKALIKSYCYTDISYCLTKSSNNISNYFIVTNELEDIVFADIKNVCKNGNARLISFSGVDYLENKEIIKNTVIHIFDWLESKKISSLKLDFADNKSRNIDCKENLFNICIKEVFNEKKYNFLIFGENSDLTFGEFNKLFNSIFDLNYEYKNINLNKKNIENINKIQKEMMKDYNDNYNNKFLSYNEINKIKEEYIKKYITKDKKNICKI